MLKPLAALAFAAIAAPTALACSCLPCDSQPPLLESEYTAGAFVGELLSVRKLTSGDLPAGAEFGVPEQHELIHLFKVTRSLKGDMPKYVMVRSASNSGSRRPRTAATSRSSLVPSTYSLTSAVTSSFRIRIRSTWWYWITMRGRSSRCARSIP